MTFESTLYTVLGQDAGVATLVGTRIYPLVRPQGGTLPAVVWQEISASPANAMDGFGNLTSYRIQITAWAKTFKAAAALRDAIRAALQAENESISPPPRLRSTWQPSGPDSFEQDTRLYGCPADFTIWYRHY